MNQRNQPKTIALHSMRRWFGEGEMRESRNRQRCNDCVGSKNRNPTQTHEHTDEHIHDVTLTTYAREMKYTVTVVFFTIIFSSLFSSYSLSLPLFFDSDADSIFRIARTYCISSILFISIVFISFFLSLSCANNGNVETEETEYKKITPIRLNEMKYCITNSAIRRVCSSMRW